MTEPGEGRREAVAKEVHRALSQHNAKGHNAAARIAFSTADRILAALEGAEPVVDVVAAIRRQDGKYWLCRRSDDGAHGGLAGMWEYPGGKVEDGEQLREALVRELTEEFGEVSPQVGAVLDSITYGAYRVTFFDVEMDDPEILNAHTETRWMTPAEARAVEHLPSGTIFNARHLRHPPEHGTGRGEVMWLTGDGWLWKLDDGDDAREHAEWENIDIEKVFVQPLRTDHQEGEDG